LSKELIMPPATTKSTPYAPAKSDAYTGLLVISLLALIAACVFLYLDWSSYSSSKPPAVPPIAPKAAPGQPPR
jgi:hypothetical protein